jgi:hypothetical protein
MTELSTLLFLPDHLKAMDEIEGTRRMYKSTLLVYSTICENWNVYKAAEDIKKEDLERVQVAYAKAECNYHERLIRLISNFNWNLKRTKFRRDHHH